MGVPRESGRGRMRHSPAAPGGVAETGLSERSQNLNDRKEVSDAERTRSEKNKATKDQGGEVPVLWLHGDTAVCAHESSWIHPDHVLLDGQGADRLQQPVMQMAIRAGGSMICTPEEAYEFLTAGRW